jgi:O-antigen/teichoic acid export membrane protein
MPLMQLRARLDQAVHSPRVWALLATLFTRGSGFLASFSLSRLAGAEALSLYISTVITASSVATPIAQVLFNGATLASTAAPSQGWLRQLLRVNAMLAMLLIGPICVCFYLMHWDTAAALSDHLHVSRAWLVAAGLSTVAGQILVAVLGGMLNGMGAQLQSARLTAVLAAVILCTSYPAVAAMGVSGAWSVLMLSSWLPVLLQWAQFRQFLKVDWKRQVAMADVHADRPMAIARRHFMEGLPNALTLTVTGGVGWFCSIYLVHRFLGAESVAVLAVANQWMTLMLLPATSWGGVMLGELAHARASNQDRPAVRGLLRRLLQRNVLVTLAVVCVVVIGAHWLELAYRLQGRDLPTLLVISGITAVLGAAFGVYERVFICWNKQVYLVGFAAISLSAQVLFTYVLVQHSIVYVQAGALLSGAMTLALGMWRMRPLLRGLEARAS